MRIGETNRVVRNHQEFTLKGMKANQVDSLRKDVIKYEKGLLKQPYELKRLITRLIRRVDYLDLPYWRNEYHKKK